MIIIITNNFEKSLSKINISVDIILSQIKKYNLVWSYENIMIILDMLRNNDLISGFI